MNEKEGLIQRFEYTFELACETFKDYPAIIIETTYRHLLKKLI